MFCRFKKLKTVGYNSCDQMKMGINKLLWNLDKYNKAMDIELMYRRKTNDRRKVREGEMRAVEEESEEICFD